MSCVYSFRFPIFNKKHSKFVFYNISMDILMKKQFFCIIDKTKFKRGIFTLLLFNLNLLQNSDPSN